MEEFVRYAMACGLCFGIGSIFGVLCQAKRTRDWLKYISRVGNPKIVHLSGEDDTLDVYVVNVDNLHKILPIDSCVELERKSEGATY